MILAKKSAQHLESSSVVLAPEDPAWVMGLLDSSLRFPSIRAIETIHVFKNGNRMEEGIQAGVQAQRLLTDGEPVPERVEALREVLRRGVDAVVATVQAYPVVVGLLEAEGRRWRVAEETAQYKLIMFDYPATAVQCDWQHEGKRSELPRDATTASPTGQSRVRR